MGRCRSRIVSIVYRFMPQYRYDFFCGLNEALAKENIALNLVYGQNSFVPKMDVVEIDWAVPIRNRVLKIGKHDFCWQPIPSETYESDLVILMQENKILTNHYLMLRSLLNKQKIALWGHGLNLQVKRNSLGNLFKRVYSNRVFWWFAYTKGVARVVAEMGFPEDRITVVNNAIDTKGLAEQAKTVSEDQIADKKRKLGIGNGPIGLFCGGMYKEKRLDFLILACKRIRKEVPSFEMIFIGAGSESSIVADAAHNHRWIHYVGPIFGVDRIVYFKMAEAFLMPGLVGLAILDCFALETPLITTAYPHHSPEIEYLVNFKNGIMVEDSVDAFVQCVTYTLSSEELKTKLKRGCREGTMNYTVEKMITNFATGIRHALNEEFV